MLLMLRQPFALYSEVDSAAVMAEIVAQRQR
jgi:hypothetical protein